MGKAPNTHIIFRLVRLPMLPGRLPESPLEKRVLDGEWQRTGMSVLKNVSKVTSQRSETEEVFNQSHTYSCLTLKFSSHVTPNQ